MLSMRDSIVARTLAIAVGSAGALMGARSFGPRHTPLLEPPGRDSQARIEGDTAILVNGRRVTPVGRVLRTQSYAWGLARLPDVSRAAVLPKDAFELADLRAPYAVRRVPPFGPNAPRTRNPEPRTG